MNLTDKSRAVVLISLGFAFGAIVGSVSHSIIASQSSLAQCEKTAKAIGLPATKDEIEAENKRMRDMREAAEAEYERNQREAERYFNGLRNLKDEVKR